MYLREANDDDQARGRAACLEQRIEELEGKATEDIRARLDLAKIYHWQCKLPDTLRLVEPLITSEFPDEVVLEARQLLADALFRHDRYDEADQRYTENLRMAEQCGSDYWIARAKDGLGWVLVDTGHMYSGEFNNGREVFDSTLEIYQKLGQRRGEAMAMFGLSRATAGAGDYDTAIDYADRAIKILQEIDAHDHLQMPLHQLGMVFRDYGVFERSIIFFEQAMDAADRAQDPRMQVDIALAYGILLKWMGRGEEAREWWLKAQPTIQELDFPRFGHETNRWLANYAAETKRFEEAYTCLSAANDYGTRIGMVAGTLRHQHMVLRKELDRYLYMADSLMYLNAGVEASLDGIFVLSHQLSSIEKGSFALRFINAAAAAMLGRPTVEILHVPISEVWRTTSAQFLLALSREVYASGGARSMNPVQLQFPGLRDRWYSVTVAKIQDGVVWTISDVTEREAMQREIVAQRDRLVALDREKSEMLGMAAHDLRSPIANIYSICELIPTDDPITRKWVPHLSSRAPPNPSLPSSATCSISIASSEAKSASTSAPSKSSRSWRESSASRSPAPRRSRSISA